MPTIPTTLDELLALSHATNPVFQGTNDEKSHNQNTHMMGEEGRCLYCDCRLGGVHYDFPCNIVALAEGVGDISTSTNSSKYWTKVSLSAHYAGIDGERFWAVSCTREGTDWFSIERSDDFIHALENFKVQSNKERG